MAEREPESPDPGIPPSHLLRKVSLADGTLRLDVFLAQQPEVHSRSDAARLIKCGQVRVDGQSAKAGNYLQPGQSVQFDPNLETETVPAEAAAGVRFPQVLFDDPCVLVVDKPPGLVAHPPVAARREVPSVAGWARTQYGDLPTVAGDDRPGIVHRLDKETSGVMVLPKTDAAFHFLKGEFKARRVRKEYRAVSFGEARFQSDHIERNIGQHPQKGDRMVIVKDGGREASTYYEVVERFRGFTSFACFPKTGRTHQIRVHMMSVGHSLVGDRFYRSRNLANARLPEGAPEPGRHCLHAHRLTFRHPHTLEELTFEAPVPGDMVALLDWLREHHNPK